MGLLAKPPVPDFEEVAELTFHATACCRVCTVSARFHCASTTKMLCRVFTRHLATRLKPCIPKRLSEIAAQSCALVSRVQTNGTIMRAFVRRGLSEIA